VRILEDTSRCERTSSCERRLEANPSKPLDSESHINAELSSAPNQTTTLLSGHRTDRFTARLAPAPATCSPALPSVFAALNTVRRPSLGDSLSASRLSAATPTPGVRPRAAPPARPAAWASVGASADVKPVHDHGQPRRTHGSQRSVSTSVPRPGSALRLPLRKSLRRRATLAVWTLGRPEEPVWTSSPSTTFAYPHRTHRDQRPVSTSVPRPGSARRLQVRWSRRSVTCGLGERAT
jgi:hypothetical protein